MITDYSFDKEVYVDNLDIDLTMITSYSFDKVICWYVDNSKRYVDNLKISNYDY